jgi:hypothetical protein
MRPPYALKSETKIIQNFGGADKLHDIRPERLFRPIAPFYGLFIITPLEAANELPEVEDASIAADLNIR